MTFYEQMIFARKQLNMTQVEMAKQLGVSFATLNRWENKKFSPRYDTQRKFEDLCTQHHVVFEGENIIVKGHHQRILQSNKR